MTGITFDELIDYLMNNHEIEFTYNSSIYIIQPEVSDDTHWLTIYTADKDTDNQCIAKLETPSNLTDAKDIISSLLSINCFNGKSFMEIEKDIHISTIY